jgi:hypothetical protein
MKENQLNQQNELASNKALVSYIMEIRSLFLASITQY